MTSPQRHYIHELAKAYNAYTESQDKEPNRSVFLVITRLTKIPSLSVHDAVEMLHELEKENSRLMK